MSAAPAATGAGPITLQELPEVAVGTDNKITAALPLASKSQTAVTISLAVERIENDVTHALTKPQAITFDGSPTGQITVPPEGKVVLLSIESSGWQPGCNVATLTADAKWFGTVIIRNLRPSLQDISIPNPDQIYYAAPGTANLLTFQNGGQLDFPLKWRLVVDGTPSEYQTLILRAGESASSRLANIPSQWRRNLFFQDLETQGAVELSLESALEPPLRSIPLKVHVVRRAWMQLLAIICIFLLILAGAVFSYVVNLAIPNLRKISSMKTDVVQLNHRVSGVTDRIDSRLRVLIASELKHLRVRATVVGDALLPSFPDSYAANMDALGSLKSRLDHIERLDDLRAHYDLATGTFPPQVLAVIDDELQAAADLLRSLRPTQGDLENARKKLDDASIKLDTARTSADTNTTLLDEAKRLQEGLAVFKDKPIEDDVRELIQALAKFPSSAADYPQKTGARAGADSQPAETHDGSNGAAAGADSQKAGADDGSDAPAGAIPPKPQP